MQTQFNLEQMQNTTSVLNLAGTLIGMNMQYERVIELLDARAIPKRKQRRELADACGITYQAVQAWGTRTPEIDLTHLRTIAGKWQGNLEYLEHGRGPLLARTPDQNVREIDPPKPLPLISWVAAGTWDEAIDNLSPGDAEEWLYSPFPSGPRSYLLEVSGLSMWPDYEDREIIQVDPDLAHKHGDDVIARTPDGKTTFKRFYDQADGTYLMAVNEAWPDRILTIPPGTAMCGVVVGSWRRRKK